MCHPREQLPNFHTNGAMQPISGYIASVWFSPVLSLSICKQSNMLAKSKQCYISMEGFLSFIIQLVPFWGFLVGGRWAGEIEMAAYLTSEFF